jgi:hypothetical protein
MTYQCPQCRRQIRTLDDEYGDHGCPCGWGPYEESEYENEGDDAE